MPYQSTCSHMVNLTTTPVQAIVHSKEIHVCEDCDNRGPNLWICLQQDCLQVGCSETVKNHSTYHNQLHRNHPIQLNLTTNKVWCYECSEEVFLPVVPHDSDAEMDEHKYRDSGHGSYSTLRSHTPERELVYGIRRNMGMSGDTSESSDGEDNPTVNDTRPMGLVGLQNIGNTCYMNAALQALSNTAPLTSFFLECPASVYMLSEGRKPGLSRTYQTLMKDMWLRKNGGYVTPSGILCGIRNVHAMFRGFQQHDTQEFLRNFMDQLHEELKQTHPPAHVTISPSIDRNLLSSMSSSSGGGGGGPSNTVTMATGGAPGGSGGPLLQQPQPQSEQQRYHHNSSSYESSDGEEYETCDSGVSERSSLSDDTERVMTTPSVVQQQQKRRLSRSGSPGRRLRARKQGSATVTDSQPCSSNPTTTNTKLSTSHHIPTTSTTIVPEKTASNSTITNKQQQTSNTNKQTSNTNNNKQQINNTNKQQTNNTNNKQQTNNTNKQQTNNNKQQTNNNKQQTNNTNNNKQQTNNTNSTSTSTNTSPTTSSKTHRSIISDIFDGKLLSSVQCLTCDRISSRVETFQDLSLPIPSRDHLVVLHGRSVAAAAAAAAAATSLTSATGSGESLTASGVTEAAAAVGAGWLSWILAWLRSWFYGPTVTLHDCLSAFFSRDELKGDNMYSCEKCSKLRNGIKYSKVLQLPEVLCIHLKRFRHELMYSSKISASVIFPLRGLDMRPYLHEECVSQVTGYELFSVICHHGTAGGGHYTCYALNNNQWYEFDDQYVTETTADQVLQCEAYVLFYRKCHFSPGSHDSSPRSQRNHVNQIALQLINDHNQHHQLHQYSHWQSDDEARDHQQQVAYVSKQWLSRFKTCAEPGPIDNADFLCIHGGVAPGRERDLSQVATRLPLSVYEYLLDRYGGCVPVQTVTVCTVCTKLLRKISYELDTFLELNAEFQGEGDPPTHFLATSWYVQWHNFVQKHTLEPPGPIDNTKLESGDTDDCVEVNEAIWSFFIQCYGGGPEIRISAPPPPPTLNLTSSVATEEDPEDANYSQPPPSYPATTTVTPPPPPCHPVNENNDTCPPPPDSMDVDDKIPEFVIPTRRRNNDNKHKTNKHNSSSTTTTAVEICNNIQSSTATQLNVTTPTTTATVLPTPTVTNDGGDGDCDSAVNDASTSIGGSDSSVTTAGTDPSPGQAAAGVVNGYGMSSVDTEMATVDNNETSTSSATITTASQKRNANTRYRRRMRDVN